MMRPRFLGPVMLPLLLGASVAVLLSPDPAVDAHAATDRSDKLKQQVEEQKCLKKIDYQRMEAERAKALEARLVRLEKAITKLYSTTKGVEKDVGEIAGELKKIGSEVRKAKK